jgi:hypothetical protein
MPGSVEPAKTGSRDAWLDCRIAVESVCPICRIGAIYLPFLLGLASLRIRVIQDLAKPICVQSQVTTILPHFENAHASIGNVKAALFALPSHGCIHEKIGATSYFRHLEMAGTRLSRGGAVIRCMGRNYRER